VIDCAGVAIGAGWQSLVAFINIGCYYLVGLPLGALFGFKLNLGALVRTRSNQIPFWKNGQYDSDLL
jgi:Na+-driven multidrug efflux pump